MIEKSRGEGGAEREMWGRRRENKKAGDATQLELSVVNKPRCLRDKEDERVCKILSSLLP